jgi:hypothetical protein
MKRGFTLEEAERIATEIGVHWPDVLFNVEQFRKGLDVELEHGKRSPDTNVTNDDPLATGKIALAHLLEKANYYELLALLESGAVQLEQGPEMTVNELSDAVESYDRTVSFASTKGEQEKIMEHPTYIKVAGHLYQLEPEEAPTSIRVNGFEYDRVDAPEEPAAPTFIKVKGMLFRRDDSLVEAAKKGKKKGKKAPKKSPKKDDKKDDKKGKAKGKGDKKDDDKSKGKWNTLPKGWTKKSAKSFWNSIGGSVTDCKRKLKDDKDIDNAGEVCANLKNLAKDEDWGKESPKKKKSKKASTGAPTIVTYKGVRYELED